MNKEYKDIIESLQKLLNNELLDLLPFDIAEEIQCLFDIYENLEKEV